MIDFEKILAFTTQVTGSLSAWQTIIANIAAFVAVIFSRNALNCWYATLYGMDNSIITAASWLFMISVYAIIYKAVSACFKAVSNFKTNRLKEREKTAQKERMMKDIQALSKQEIAILKFVIAQPSHVAWLPASYAPVIILAKKGLISLFSKKSKNIPAHSRYYEFLSEALLFVVPEYVQKLVADMPLEFMKKWRRIKPDRSLDECQ